MSPPKSMSAQDASRIQSTQATGGKDMSSSGFAARAQSAAATNANSGNTSNTGKNTGNNNTGNKK